MAVLLRMEGEDDWTLKLIVIGFDDDKYARDIVAELKDLRRAHTIRLFDALYVIKHPDGTMSDKEISDLAAEERREYGTLAESLIGLSAQGLEHVNADAVAEALSDRDDEFGLSDQDIQDIADQLPSGSSALFVIFEHAWARDIKDTMLRSGGYVRAQGFIDPNTLMKATNELAAVLEAVEKSEASTLERMTEVVTGAKAEEEQARERADVAESKAKTAVAAAAATVAGAKAKAERAEQVEAEAEAREEAARLQAAEAEAQAEAMEDAAFAEAEAVRRAAKRQEEEAITEAAEVVAMADEIEAAAIIRAVDALVTAKIIESAAAREALDAIIAADVNEASAAQRAARSLDFQP